MRASRIPPLRDPGVRRVIAAGTPGCRARGRWPAPARDADRRGRRSAPGSRGACSGVMVLASTRLVHGVDERVVVRDRSQDTVQVHVGALVIPARRGRLAKLMRCQQRPAVHPLPLCRSGYPAGEGGGGRAAGRAWRPRSRVGASNPDRRPSARAALTTNSSGVLTLGVHDGRIPEVGRTHDRAAAPDADRRRSFAMRRQQRRCKPSGGSSLHEPNAKLATDVADPSPGGAQAVCSRRWPSSSPWPAGNVTPRTIFSP